MEKQPKVFINGPFINEHVFNDGGSILKVSIPADKIDALCEQLKFSADSSGWVRLVIAKNRNPTTSKKTGKVISTHSLSVDTWQPKQGQAATQLSAPAPAKAAQDDGVADDVPF